MLNELFVREIKTLAEKAMGAQIVDIHDNQQALIIDGQIALQFKKNEPFGSTTVADFESLIVLAESLVPKAETAIVRVGRDSMSLCCDMNKPHKVAKVELKYQHTAAYEALLQWESRPLTVASIVKALKTKLHGTFADGLLPIFRQVEFARSGSTTVSKIGHRDTMGKSVDNAVRSSAGELPEAVVFSTPLFSNIPCSKVALQFYVESDAAAESIGITRIGDQVENSIQMTVFEIINRLKEALPQALVVAC